VGFIDEFLDVVFGPSWDRNLEFHFEAELAIVVLTDIYEALDRGVLGDRRKLQFLLSDSHCSSEARGVPSGEKLLGVGTRSTLTTQPSRSVQLHVQCTILRGNVSSATTLSLGLRLKQASEETKIRPPQRDSCAMERREFQLTVCNTLYARI
jgi:hypothetical protein